MTVTLPSNGLLQIRYFAQWSESVAQQAQAAIFIGANQLQVPYATTGQRRQAEAATHGGATCLLYTSDAADE